MKSFLLFAGDHYYPSGGWGDFQSAHDSLGEAFVAATLPISFPETSFDWWHVIDLSSGLVALNSQDWRDAKKTLKKACAARD